MAQRAVRWYLYIQYLNESISSLSVGCVAQQPVAVLIAFQPSTSAAATQRPPSTVDIDQKGASRYNPGLIYLDVAAVAAMLVHKQTHTKRAHTLVARSFVHPKYCDVGSTNSLDAGAYSVTTAVCVEMSLIELTGHARRSLATIAFCFCTHTRTAGSSPAKILSTTPRQNLR